MAKSDTPARDALLVKYLNEAYGKERQLETALQAQIGLAQRPQLVKGLKDHLKVTKAQARGLQQRIRALGGKPDAGELPGPEAVTSLANKALAAAKGPVQALRGTSGADQQLRNVRDSYWNEAEEIAHYSVIESVATALGDKETAKLAKQYRREEERMQKLLERQISALAKDVIREEVPAAERRSVGGTRRRTARRRPTSATSSSRTASSSGSSRGASGSQKSSSSSSPRAKRAASATTKRSSTTGSRAGGSGAARKRSSS